MNNNLSDIGMEAYIRNIIKEMVEEEVENKFYNTMCKIAEEKAVENIKTLTAKELCKRWNISDRFFFPRTFHQNHLHRQLWQYLGRKHKRRSDQSQPKRHEDIFGQSYRNVKRLEQPFSHLPVPG